MTALEIWCLMNIIFVFQVCKMPRTGNILVLVIFLMPPLLFIQSLQFKKKVYTLSLLQALLAYVVILVRSKLVNQPRSSVDDQCILGRSVFTYIVMFPLFVSPPFVIISDHLPTPAPYHLLMDDEIYKHPR